MKLITITLAGMLFAVTLATTNFHNTCGTVNSQMSSLSQYISQVKQIADYHGHRAISDKCKEASAHLAASRSSWNTISSGYSNFPWAARSSPHAGVCQSRLSSCGSSIDWIHSRPEVARIPAYRVPLSNCRAGHRSCQDTCGQVWNWPSPPGYKPRPSGYFRKRHEASKTLCPAPNETACPIAPGALGHECVDVQSEITSCGGCATRNEGENCLSIEGADEVGCEAGVCRTFSVLPGYALSPLSKRPLAM